MANKRFWLGMLVVALTFGMTVVGCDDESGNDPNNDPSNDSNNDSNNNPSNNPSNNPGSENYKADWLWAGSKYYKVTDGVVGSIDYEINNVTYTNYTDDRHYNSQYNYTVPYNTTTSTYSQVGSSQVSYNYSRNGNTDQSTSHSISDITYNHINGTQVSYTIDTTQTTTSVYDAGSGLTLLSTSQQTGTNNGNPVNTNTEIHYTIELLRTEGDVKTYEHTITGYTLNGETVFLNSGYEVYKIQNSITLEQRSYTADGTLSRVGTYTPPDDAIIKKKLPTHYNTSTNYTSGDSISQTIELVSDSNTELRILIKNYSNGVLSSQYEQTYRPR
jgi:hypothetical protein